MTWTHVYAAATIAAALSTAALLAWLLYDVCWARRERKTGASLQADPELLRRLQRARRELGSRWVLHPSRPLVNWGIRRG